MRKVGKLLLPLLLIINNNDNDKADVVDLSFIVIFYAKTSMQYVLII